MRAVRVTVLMMVAALIPLGCDQMKPKPAPAEEKSKQEEATKPVIIPVEATHLSRGAISACFETTARIEAERKVDILSKGIGRCVQIFAEEGQWVEAGAILAELDRDEAEAALRQAEVQLRQRTAEYERVRGSRDADGDLLYSNAEYEALKFAMEQAQAAVNTQRVQIQNLTVRAPITGVITSRRIQVGALVTSALPIFSMVDPDSFMLVVHPPEKDLARLHEGQVARITVDALGSETFEAAVRRINPNVDPTSGTVKVTLDFAPEVRKKLRDSAFARVNLIMETHENALLAPKDALVEENSRKYLFIVRDTDPAEVKTEETKPASEGQPSEPALYAERLEVQTGFEDSNSVEVLAGVDESARIVTFGQRSLKTGSRVLVTTAEAEVTKTSSITPEEALQKAKEEGDKPVPTTGHRQR